MKIKKVLKLTLLPFLAVTPVITLPLIVTSCSNNDNSGDTSQQPMPTPPSNPDNPNPQPQPEPEPQPPTPSPQPEPNPGNKPQEDIKLETSIKPTINARTLGLKNKTIDEIIKGNIINKDFVFENISKILTGSYNIDNSSKIMDTSVSKADGMLHVQIELAPGTCYNTKGALIESSKRLSFVITGLKVNTPTTSKLVRSFDINLTKKTANQVINEKIITNRFVFDHFDKFFSGSHKVWNYRTHIVIGQIKKITETKIEVNIRLMPNTWYNDAGELSPSTRSFTIQITNLFPEQVSQTIINPTVQSADLGLTGTATEIFNDKDKFINTDFLINNIEKIFQGTVVINNPTTDIKINNIILSSKTQITIQFKLAPTTWYEQNGSLGNGIKTFEFTIDFPNAALFLNANTNADNNTNTDPNADSNNNTNPNNNDADVDQKKKESIVFYSILGGSITLAIILIIIIIVLAKKAKKNREQSTAPQTEKVRSNPEEW